jgi:hypothetical protein
MKKTARDNLMLRYLLGDLSEEEQFALEQEYFADSEKFEQVWALENELVDDYVRDRLPKQERALFERNYLVSPKHRERVAAARHLLQAADVSLSEENVPAEKPVKSGVWVNWLALLRPSPLAWAGLALLFLALGGWWYFRTISYEQIAGTTPPSSLPNTQIPTSPTPSPSSPASTTTPTPVASPLQSQATPSARPSMPVVLAFALLGRGSRAEGNPQQLVIPNGTKQVRLQMKLDQTESQAYQIRLRNVDGGEIFSQAALRPAANKKSVIAIVPAAKLTPGDYIATLSSRNRAGEAEEVDRYFFRVTR